MFWAAVHNFIGDEIRGQGFGCMSVFLVPFVLVLPSCSMYLSMLPVYLYTYCYDRRMRGDDDQCTLITGVAALIFWGTAISIVTLGSLLGKLWNRLFQKEQESQAG